MVLVCLIFSALYFLVDMKFMVVLSLIKSMVACFYLSVLFSCKFFKSSNHCWLVSLGF